MAQGIAYGLLNQVRSQIELIAKLTEIRNYAANIGEAENKEKIYNKMMDPELDFNNPKIPGFKQSDPGGWSKTWKLDTSNWLRKMEVKKKYDELIRNGVPPGEAQQQAIDEREGIYGRYFRFRGLPQRFHTADSSRKALSDLRTADQTSFVKILDEAVDSGLTAQAYSEFYKDQEKSISNVIRDATEKFNILNSSKDNDLERLQKAIKKDFLKNTNIVLTSDEREALLDAAKGKNLNKQQMDDLIKDKAQEIYDNFKLEKKNMTSKLFSEVKAPRQSQIKRRMIKNYAQEKWLANKAKAAAAAGRPTGPHTGPGMVDDQLEQKIEYKTNLMYKKSPDPFSKASGTNYSERTKNLIDRDLDKFTGTKKRMGWGSRARSAGRGSVGRWFKDAARRVSPKDFEGSKSAQVARIKYQASKSLNFAQQDEISNIANEIKNIGIMNNINNGLNLYSENDIKEMWKVLGGGGDDGVSNFDKKIFDDMKLNANQNKLYNKKFNAGLSKDDILEAESMEDLFNKASGGAQATSSEVAEMRKKLLASYLARNREEAAKLKNQIDARGVDDDAIKKTKNMLSDSETQIKDGKNIRNSEIRGTYRDLLNQYSEGIDFENNKSIIQKLGDSQGLNQETINQMINIFQEQPNAVEREKMMKSLLNSQIAGKPILSEYLPSMTAIKESLPSRAAMNDALEKWYKDPGKNSKMALKELGNKVGRGAGMVWEGTKRGADNTLGTGLRYIGNRKNEFFEWRNKVKGKGLDIFENIDMDNELGEWVQKGIYDEAQEEAANEIKARSNAIADQALEMRKQNLARIIDKIDKGNLRGWSKMGWFETASKGRANIAEIRDKLKADLDDISERDLDQADDLNDIPEDFKDEFEQTKNLSQDMVRDYAKKIYALRSAPLEAAIILRQRIRARVASKLIGEKGQDLIKSITENFINDIRLGRASAGWPKDSNGFPKEEPWKGITPAEFDDLNKDDIKEITTILKTRAALADENRKAQFAEYEKDANGNPTDKARFADDGKKVEGGNAFAEDSERNKSLKSIQSPEEKELEDWKKMCDDKGKMAEFNAVDANESLVKDYKTRLMRFIDKGMDKMQAGLHGGKFMRLGAADLRDAAWSSIKSGVSGGAEAIGYGFKAAILSPFSRAASQEAWRKAIGEASTEGSREVVEKALEKSIIKKAVQQGISLGAAAGANAALEGVAAATSQFPCFQLMPGMFATIASLVCAVATISSIQLVKNAHGESDGTLAKWERETVLQNAGQVTEDVDDSELKGDILTNESIATSKDSINRDAIYSIKDNEFDSGISEIDQENKDDAEGESNANVSLFDSSDGIQTGGKSKKKNLTKRKKYKKKLTKRKKNKKKLTKRKKYKKKLTKRKK